MTNENPLSYEFTTDESNPNRVSRLEAEFVDFTLNMTLQCGDVHLITEPEHVQNILDKAHEFNTSQMKETTSSGIKTDLVKKKGGAIIEVSLDDVNSVNIFHVPA
jgi:hypothetical protein|eukprot:scaffold1980_cov228-Chaetoceros_neogracile.AAC.1